MQAHYFFSLHEGKLEEVKSFIIQNLTPQMFKLIQKYYPDEAKQFIKNGGGFYQNLVCALFQQHRIRLQNLPKSNMQIFLQSHSGTGLLCNHFFPQQILLQKIDEKYISNKQVYKNQAQNSNLNKPLHKLQRKIKKLQEAVPQLAESMTNDGKQGCYARMSQGNPVFDFLLSKCEEGVLKLFLVDLTLRFDEGAVEKIQSFYEDLLENTSFKKLIAQCSKVQKVKNIEICFYVLHCQKSYYPKQIQISNKYIAQQINPHYEDKVQEFKQHFSKVTTITSARGLYGFDFWIKLSDQRFEPIRSKYDPSQYFLSAKK